MKAIEAIRERLPDAARDLKLNLSAVLSESRLSESQRWGVALASAIAARNQELLRAVMEDATAHLDENGVDDARAAAALMGMNNVFYRFRSMVEKEEYGAIPARLRMNRIARPLGPKVDFELYCLAVSAINGCGTCVKSHEKVVRDGGFEAEQIHDAIRIAATVQGVAIALEMWP